jgi:hypothetical protein
VWRLLGVKVVKVVDEEGTWLGELKVPSVREVRPREVVRVWYRFCAQLVLW